MARSPLSNRAVAIGIALVLALIATLALISYVRGIEQRALKGVESVEALVAKEVIPKGTGGDDAISKGLIGRQTIPRKALVEGAIKSLEELKGKIAIVDIQKGEQILGVRFVSPTKIKGVLPIPSDRQAISVEVGVPPSVAGFIQPGDRVSIIAKLESGAGGRSEVRVQYFLQDILVLAVGQLVVTPEGGAPSVPEGQTVARGLLTLALTPAEAEKLAYAVFFGQLHFTLLPPGQKPVGTPGRTRENVFS